ncbi:MAG: peptidoglycan editing factor PgeF [Candidatus Omnitrophica bacterium]|nr:peptidoglycan editing factor PgeF [Candidatus Omnitrophota bacterium]
MLSFNSFFPDSVLTFVTDHQIDFSFYEGGLSVEQRSFLKKHAGEYPVINVRQVHGGDVLIVNDDMVAGTFYEADGVLTNKTDVLLCVRTADCLSVFLCDPITKVIGVVHAGWRGTQKNIMGHAVHQMIEVYGASPGHIKAAFGPCICGSCYEVGTEFLDYFPRHTHQKNNKVCFDLVAANESQLTAEGVLTENILKSSVCTFEQTSYFSYRRDGKNTGRILSAIMIKSKP